MTTTWLLIYVSDEKTPSIISTHTTENKAIHAKWDAKALFSEDNQYDGSSITVVPVTTEGV